MKRKPWNIIFHELIGLPVRVRYSWDPSLQGLEGRVYWETTRTILINVGDRLVRVVKPGTVFEFYLEEYGWVPVRGDHLLGTPGERAKRLVRVR